MNIKSKPIASAPRDGTVILTDAGTVCYVDQSGWGGPVTDGWWLCEPGCQPQMPEDMYPVCPTKWAPIPELS